MSTYYCKCGRQVQKSTKATTTGNRDVAGCAGCPYRMPYGPLNWDSSEKAFVREVQGYECRMTDHPCWYSTQVSRPGGPDDKTVMHIESLDFDFLRTVTDWVRDTFPGGELTGGLQAYGIRSSDYLDGVRITFAPSQNKKGAAAKQQLFDQFFGRDHVRRDLAPKEERLKILAIIDKGIEKAKETAMERIYKDSKGYLYKAGCVTALGNSSVQQYSVVIRREVDPEGSWHKMRGAPRWAANQVKEACLYLDQMAEADGMEAVEVWSGEPVKADEPEGTPLDGLELSARGLEALHRADIWWVEDLLSYTEDDLYKIRDLGKRDIDKLLPHCDQTAADTNVGTSAADEAYLENLGLSEACIRHLTQDLCFDRDDTVGDLHGLLDSEREALQEKFPEDWAKIQTALKDQTAEESSDAAMYQDDAGRIYKIGVWEEGNSGDRYGILYSDNGDGLKHYKGSPVYGPEVNKPRELAQLKLDQMAKEHGMREYIDAANPTDAAPDSPAEDGAAMLSPSAADTASLEAGQAFDYSGLELATADTLRWAESRIREARSKYITDVAEAVSVAHEALCGVVANCEDSKHGNRGEDTFRAWCQSVGLKKDTAYRLLQVSALLAGATDEEAAQLEQASPSLLYAAAKPSAPAQLVQAVKDGDITTHKQYKELEKQLAEAREAQRQAEVGRAYAVKDLKELRQEHEEDRQWMDDEIEKANRKATLAQQKAQENWDTVVAEKESRIRAEKARDAVQRQYDEDMPEMQRLIDEARDERDLLKQQLAEMGASQTIEASVVDPEEVERRAQELADQAIGQMEQRYANMTNAVVATAQSTTASIMALWQSSGLGRVPLEDVDERDALLFLADTLIELHDEILEHVQEYEEA